MQTKHLNIIIILVLLCTPLTTILIMFQLSPGCDWYFAPHCASPPVWLFGLLPHWVGSGILRNSLLTLAAYGGLLIVKTKIPSLPYKIILAFAIILIPLGAEVSDYIPFGLCALGIFPQCIFTRWLEQAVLDWYGNGPLALSLITLVVYGLVLRTDMWLAHTNTDASTYVPVSKIDS